MDLLEYADTLGFDGIGVNEHHQNGYGIMPSPEHHRRGPGPPDQGRRRWCVLGNSIALYNPPIRVAEEFAMLDCISGGRLVAGFPVGTSMDTNYCYGQIPALTRDKYAEAHELIIKAWTTREPVRLQRPVQQAALRQLLAEAHPAAASADHIPGGGSVETWDFCIDNDYNYSYLSFTGYLRAKALMDGYWERVAERGARTTRPTGPASPRSSASPTPTRRPSGSTPSTSGTSTTAASTSIRASPTPPAIGPSRPSRPARFRQYAPPRGASRA